MKDEFQFDYRRGKEEGETEAKEWEIRGERWWCASW
jgi:hypothetical protein